MARRTPTEKKQQSLAKDRRNTYGESPHAARKAIPKRKRLRARAERAAARATAPDEDAFDAAAAAAAAKRRKAWRKVPDVALGAVVAAKLARREADEARSTPAREAAFRAFLAALVADTAEARAAAGESACDAAEVSGSWTGGGGTWELCLEHEPTGVSIRGSTGDGRWSGRQLRLLKAALRELLQARLDHAVARHLRRPRRPSR